MNLLPSNKIILEWEPWCGKTMIAYIISNALKRELKIVNLSKIISSHLWETASNLSSIFEKYSNENHILFIDEFDIIWRLRWDTNTDHNEMKRIVNSLLQLIDYFPTKWILIFATNDIKIIDKALLRRMDRIIHVPLPTKANIKTFIKNKLIEYKQQIWDINYNELVKKYNGESYSNIDRDMKNKIKKYVIETRKKNIKNFKISTEVFL
jgi:SpoVK/Ycf46/Vps4 family AAA+-type ATPase